MSAAPSGSPIDVAEEVLAAEQRIRAHIRRTPLDRSNHLSALTDADVYLKLESAQITGSFKLRGAMNKMFSLTDEEKARGVLTASSGNHGTACAYLMARFDIAGTIYLPENVAPTKLGAIRAHGVATELVPGDGIEAEKRARYLAAERGLTYISPYNDPLIIGGTGTIGLELRRQLESIDVVVVPVGGGGLVSGIAGYLKSVDPDICIIGCQPRNSRVMYESVRAGNVLDLESQPTLADGTAGGIDDDSITFELCRDLVDEWILLSEDEIGEAILLAADKQHVLLEGAGALPIAALRADPGRFRGRTVVLLASGSKLALSTLKTLMEDGDLS